MILKKIFLKNFSYRSFKEKDINFFMKGGKMEVLERIKSVMNLLESR